MNHRGKITELIVLLIIVVMTSALVLFLISSGILTVRASPSAEQILNTEFIPFAREGLVVIKEFQFCDYVDQAYHCVNPTASFSPGSDVFFRFVVETTAVQGEIILIEDYLIRKPDGTIILDVHQKNDFQVDLQSTERQELISFRDYFTLGFDTEPQDYILELIIRNPLINKETTIIQNFRVDESVAEYQEGVE